MRVILFHGTSGSPEKLWFPYMRERLEARGYEVIVPALPNAASPDLETWLSAALTVTSYGTDTILIGHSSGGSLILSILERLETPVRQAILIAAYFEPLIPGERYRILQPHYNWKKIRSMCRSFIFINSDNDPWGCDEHVGRSLVERLGGVLVVPKGEGHMGSVKFSQPYDEFPLLLKLVD